MWQIKRLEVVDPHGNSVSVVDKKITVSAKLENGLRVTKTFTCDRAPPEIHVAIKDFVRRLQAEAFP